MTFNQYYKDELNFLRQLGEEFAESHPDDAHFLRDKGSDPDVERLLEGVAFLTGRIRQKLDDEFPELIHGVMNLLWPHYLRPIPAVSLLEFIPIPGVVTGAKHIPARQTVVESREIEGTRCRFQTTADVHLHPLQLVQAVLEGAGSTAAVLRLRFTLLPGVTMGQTQITRLRLHFIGEPAYSLYACLCRHLGRISARVGGQGHPMEEVALPGCRIEPVGFARDEALFPYPKTSFDGYRLLQEYFAFPQKFLAIDLSDLGPLTGRGAATEFEIAIRFTTPPPGTLEVTKDHVRLFCTPIVNLFALDSHPIEVSHERSEYLLRPSGTPPEHYELFSVDRAVGHIRGTGKELQYDSFYSFRQSDQTRASAIYYQTHLKQSTLDDRGCETTVSFVDRGENPIRGIEVPTDIVTFDLTCTNRELPSKLLVGDIRVPTDTSPGYVEFRDVVRASPHGRVPLGGDLHWRLLAHLSLNYVSITRVETLRELLTLYNFSARQDNQAKQTHNKLLEAIVGIEHRGKDYLFRGAPVRGTEITLSLKESHFPGEGHIFLLGGLLSEFFALYASLNSFTELHITLVERGERLSWPVRIGHQVLV